MNKFKTKEEIINWLDKLNITNYTIHDNLVVDVKNSVFIDEKIEYLPINFGKVAGSFRITDNNLKSLDGSPREVDHFNCNNNKLTSLEGSPEVVYGNYDVSNNQLKNLIGITPKISDSIFLQANELESLEGCQEIVNGSFNINENRLKTLKYGPKIVYEDYNCNDNKLKDLLGVAHTINGRFFARTNKIKTLEYFPKYVEYDIVLNDNELTSLKGLPDKINGLLKCSRNKIETLIGGPSYIKESLDLSNNQLITLESFPIVEKEIDLTMNKIISLKGIQKKVWSLLLKDNQLTSLEYGPEEIEHFFLLNNSGIKDLTYAPKVMKGLFEIGENNLMTSDLEWLVNNVQFEKILIRHDTFQTIIEKYSVDNKNDSPVFFGRNFTKIQLESILLKEKLENELKENAHKKRNKL